MQKTAAMCLFWNQLGYFIFGILNAFWCTSGVPYFPCYDEFLRWCHLWGSLDALAVEVYLCDEDVGVPVFAVTKWEMLYCFIFVLFFNLLAERWWLIFVCG